MSKIGYNHPSQANWSYGIWKIDLINTDDSYCMSYTVKENFGGDSRLRAKVREATGYNMIETKRVYTGTGTQKITGLSTLLEMEGSEIVEIIGEFLKNSFKKYLFHRLYFFTVIRVTHLTPIPLFKKRHCQHSAFGRVCCG